MEKWKKFAIGIPILGGIGVLIYQQIAKAQATVKFVDLSWD